MINFEDCLKAVADAIGEPVTEAEIAESLVAQRLNSIISDLDELCALAAKSETAGIIEKEKIAIGQINTRAGLLMSFILARTPAGLRVVR